MSGKSGWNHGFVEGGDDIVMLLAVTIVSDWLFVFAQNRAKKRRRSVSENKTIGKGNLEGEWEAKRTQDSNELRARRASPSLRRLISRSNASSTDTCIQ